MRFILILCLTMFFGVGSADAQVADTLRSGVLVFHDYRMQEIKNKELEMNTAVLKNKARLIKGYRLMILNTRDKNYAFKVRAELLKTFPEQKPYMWFANPYIRLKFGNFRTEEEAEDYRRKISKMLGGANIYLLNEIIEVNPGANFEPESMREEILK